jgi:hypothetical protein
MVLKARVSLETDPDRKRQLQVRLTVQLPSGLAGRIPTRNTQSRPNFWMATWQRLIAIRAACFCGREPARSVQKSIGSPLRPRGTDRVSVARSWGQHPKLLAQEGQNIFFVGTLHPDDPYEPYRRTREFYQAMGFAYVLEEQFPADPNNPIAYYMKEIAR